MNIFRAWAFRLQELIVQVVEKKEKKKYELIELSLHQLEIYEKKKWSYINMSYKINNLPI